MAKDYFLRADESPLALPWASDGVLGGLNLASNLVRSASGDSNSYHTESQRDYSTIRVNTVGDGNFGPAICCDGAGTYYFLTNYSISNTEIYRVTSGGGWTSLAYVTHTYQAGYTYGLRRAGSDLILEINGAVALTATGVVTFTGGYDGMHMFDGGGRVDYWTNNTEIFTTMSGVSPKRRKLRQRPFAPGHRR